MRPVAYIHKKGKPIKKVIIPSKYGLTGSLFWAFTWYIVLGHAMKSGDFLDLGGSKSINIRRNRRVLGALTKPWIADTLLYPSLKGKDDSQSITRLSILKVVTYIPANTKHLYNIYTMLDQGRTLGRRCINVIQNVLCLLGWWTGRQNYQVRLKRYFTPAIETKC